MIRLCNVREQYMADKVLIGSHRSTPSRADVERTVAGRLHPITVHVRTPTTAPSSCCRPSSGATDSWPSTTWTSVPVYRRVSSTARSRVQGVEWAELEWLNVVAPVDDTDPGEGDTAPVIGAAVWQHERHVTMADPGTRHYRRNNATNPTAFAFSTTDDDGSRPQPDGPEVGDHLIYRPVQDVAVVDELRDHRRCR